MPSPFPGMDPYLEGPDWRSVHTQLSVEIARHLAPKLRPKYFIRTEKEYLLAAPDPDDLIAVTASRRAPDVSVVRVPDKTPGPTLAAAALLEPPLHVALVMPEEVPQVTVEIHDAERRALVTAIEVLSMTNKRGEGREEYLTKRRRFLHSDVHLLEIDLLRRGQRVPMAEPLPPAPYLVILSRADRRPVADVWPISLRNELPPVPVPLLPGDPDVSLDLQHVLTEMYDAFGYDLELDYTKPPRVPLEKDDATWADQLLRTHRER